MLGDLDPHWQSFQADASTDFGAFLAGRSPQVVDTLMSVADRNAEKITIPTLAKAYNSLRGKGAKFIEPAIPELGRLLQRHIHLDRRIASAVQNLARVNGCDHTIQVFLMFFL